MSRRVRYAPPRRPRLRLGALLVVVALVASSGPVGAEEPARVPARPTGLEVATEAGSLDVGLDWDDVDGADGYLVRWRLAGAGNPLNGGQTVESSEATITVDDHGEWVVRIEACNDAGCGPPLAERFTVEPGPAVDETAERYESFTGEHTAPRGILVSKFFDGIFTDPDGDELTYSAEVTGGREELVGELEVRFNERARPGYQHILWFEADDDRDWTALDPPVPNPATFEVTLTATDPDGYSASVTGVFSTRWEPPQFSAESVPASEPEAASEPETAPATDSDAASEALAVAVVADRTILVEGERVTLTAAVANAPAGSEPAYRWEMDDGGWFTVGRRAEFSYLTKNTGFWDFRVTVTYPSGETATSEPLTVAWATRAAPDARADAQGFVQGQQSTDTSLLKVVEAVSSTSSSWNLRTAQRFTVPTGGATLNKITFEVLANAADASRSVKIRKDTSTGCGGTITSCPDFGTEGLVAELSNTDSLTLTPTNSDFTAPAGTTLTAGNYWISIHEGLGTNVALFQSYDPTTVTGETGWEAGGILFRFTEDGDWSDTASGRIAFEIRGSVGITPLTPSTKATLSVNPTSITENGGVQSVDITATLDGAARDSATTVNVSFGDTGTAKIGATKDYEVLPAGTGTNTVTTGTITIAANQTSGSASFRFRPVNDIIDEGTSETITITGSTTASDLTGGVDSADLTLNDDDTVGNAITLEFITNSSATEGGATNTGIRARFDSGKARTADTVIALSYGNSTATSGADYTATLPASLTISAGQASAQSAFTLTPLDDKIREGIEFIVVVGTLAGFTFDGDTFSIIDNDEAPDRVVLSFTPVSEGAGATTSTVTATLANSDATKPQDIVLTQDVTVTLALGTGHTAMSGTDYTGLSDPLPSVTISAGSLSGTASIDITPVDDDVDDAGETIVFTATATTSQSGVTLTGVGANLVINEAPTITLTVNPASAGEAAGQTRVTVTATREDVAANATVAVTVGAVGSTATRGTDYTGNTATTISIRAGTASGNADIFIDPTDDQLVEGDETIVVAGSATGFAVAPAVFTITDNDAASTKAALSVNPTAIGENGGAQSVTVRAALDGAARASATTVSVSFGDTGTAKIGAAKDYEVLPAAGTNTITTGTITIAAGQTSGSASFRFRPVDDNIDEGASETITITGTTTASDLTGGVESADLTLNDDDATPTVINLSFDPSSITENAGNTAVTVVATLAGTSTRTEATTVNLAASLGGTATQGSLPTDDYTASGLPSSVTIPAGQSRGEATGLMINPTDNTVSDGDRTITLAQHPTNTLADFTVNGATLNLNDNEQPTITVSLSASTAAESAPNQAVSVSATRSASSTAALDVTITPQSASTAVRGADWSGSSSVTISFPQNSTSSSTAVFNINPTEDRLVEGAETIVLGAAVSGHSVTAGVFTITDNDVASTSIALSLNRSSLAESAPPRSVRVTATVNEGAVIADTTIRLGLSGIATRGTDYTAPDSLFDAAVDITIAAGTRIGSATFDIDPIDDTLDEGSGESVVFTGTKVAGDASITTVNSATLTIGDNDATPTAINLSFEPSSIVENATGDAQGDVAVKVVATLVGSSTRTVATTVNLASSLGGTATSSHYAATGLPSTVTIPAGQSSGEATGLKIDPTDNSDSDGTRTITLAEGTPALSGFTVNPASLNLNDDELPLITLSLTRLQPSGDPADSMNEGDANSRFRVTATRETGSAFSGDPVTMTLAVQDSSTATEGDTSAPGCSGDYEAMSGHLGRSIRISRNRASNFNVVQLSACQDRIIETGGETIVIGGTATGYNVVPVTLTINDDDLASTAVALTVSPDSIDEEGAATTVRVTAEVNDGAPTAATTITLAVDAASTATRNTDYSAPAALGDGTADITIAANEVSATASFSIAPTDDNLDEGTGETVIIDAAGAGNSAGGLTVPVSAAVVTIVDDDVTVNFSQGAYTAAEGGGASVTVTLNEASKRRLVIPISHTPQNGSDHPKNSAVAQGQAGADYSGVPANVTFAAGDTSASFTLSAVQDTFDDDGESVRLALGALPTGVQAGATTTAVVSIADDDDPEVTVAMSPTTATVTEADNPATTAVREDQVTITVSLSADPERTVVIPIRAMPQNGSDHPLNSATTADFDSNAVPANVTFNAGETSKMFIFDATDDDVDDDGESVWFRFGALPRRVAKGAESTVSITDDDDPHVTVMFSRATHVVGEGGTVLVTVNLSADPERTVTIPITHTPEGGASAADYSGVPASVVLNSGEIGTTIAFAAADDNVNDNDESVALSFGTPLPDRVTVGATNTATVSIIDGDVPHINRVELLTRPAEGDTFAAGEAITLRATFSEPIDVTGRGRITLSLHSADGWFTGQAWPVTGTPPRSSPWVDAGQRFSTMDFRYRVGAGTEITDRLTVGTHPVNGGGLVLTEGAALTGSSGEQMHRVVVPVEFAYRADGGPVRRTGPEHARASGPCREDIGLRDRWIEEHSAARQRTWGEGCESKALAGHWSYYYTFTLDAAAHVRLQVTGAPNAAPRLILRSGRSYSGAAVVDQSAPYRLRVDRALAAGTYTLEVVTRDPGPGPTGLGFYLWAAVIVPHDFSGLDPSCRTYISTGVSVARAVSDHPSGVCESVSAPGRAAHYLVYEGDPTAIGPLQLSSTDGITMDLNLWEDGLIVASDSTSRKGYARIGSRTPKPGSQYVVEVTAHFRRQTGRFHLTDGNQARPECGRTIEVEPRWQTRPVYQAGTGEIVDTVRVYELRFGAHASDPWGPPCNSVSQPGSYSRYYTFTLTRAWHMRFDTAAYGRLYLRQGTAGSGAWIAESHDPRQRPFHARIDHPLAAGTYTLEARSNPGRGGTTALRIGGHRIDAPDAPTAVAATPVGFDRIDVTWSLPATTPPPALEFGVAQGPPTKQRTAVVVTWHPQGNTAATNTAVLPADATAHTIGGLTGGTTYRVTVAARNPADDTGAAAVTASLAGSAPDAPSGVGTSDLRHDRMRVSWTLPDASLTPSKPRTAVVVTWSPGNGTAVLAADATSHTITGLTHSTAYTITVKARNAIGDSTGATASASTVTIQAPDQLTNLRTSDIGDDRLTVSWTLAASVSKPVTAVTIRYRVTGSSSSTEETLAGDATSYTITGLTADTNYTIQAWASNDAGNAGGTAPSVTATTTITPLAVWFSGDTPKITLGGSTEVRIFLQVSTTKNAAVTCAVGGGVTINCPRDTLVSLGAVDRTSSSHSFHAHLIDGTLNRVGCCDQVTVNRVKYEAELTITATALNNAVTPHETATPDFKFYADAGGPRAPQVAVSAAPQSIAVGWSAPDGLGKPGNVLSGFQVWHRQQGATTWNKSSWLAATAREYTITGLTDGTTYQVRVRARAQSNNHAGTLTQYEGMTTGTCTADYRVMCNATPTSGNAAPGTPQNPDADAVPGTSGAGKVAVSWTAPAVVGGSTGTYHRYRIDYYHTGNKTGTLQTAYVDGRTTSTTLEGLTSGTGYSFEIRAEGGGGDSAYTTAVTATPN